jgi:hypothetical protein
MVLDDLTARLAARRGWRADDRAAHRRLVAAVLGEPESRRRDGTSRLLVRRRWRPQPQQLGAIDARPPEAA